VKLYRVSHHEPALSELVELFLRQKERVRRADASLVAEPLSRDEQSALYRCVFALGGSTTYEELRPGRGSKRHRGD
jgi:hypothetical protein